MIAKELAKAAIMHVISLKANPDMAAEIEDKIRANSGIIAEVLAGNQADFEDSDDE